MIIEEIVGNIANISDSDKGKHRKSIFRKL